MSDNEEKPTVDSEETIHYKFPAVSYLQRELQLHKFASDPTYVCDKPLLEITAKKFAETTKEHFQIKRECAVLVDEYYVDHEKRMHYNYELTKLVIAGALIDIGKKVEVK